MTRSKSKFVASASWFDLGWETGFKCTVVNDIYKFLATPRQSPTMPFGFGMSWLQLIIKVILCFALLRLAASVRLGQPHWERSFRSYFEQNATQCNANCVSSLSSAQTSRKWLNCNFWPAPQQTETCRKNLNAVILPDWSEFCSATTQQCKIGILKLKRWHTYLKFRHCTECLNRMKRSCVL